MHSPDHPLGNPPEPESEYDQQMKQLDDYEKQREYGANGEHLEDDLR